jgi:hypothetical protein
MKKIMAALLALAATLAQAQMPEPRFGPAQGQTAEKQATDLTECGRRSEEQTGYSRRPKLDTDSGRSPSMGQRIGDEPARRSRAHDVLRRGKSSSGPTEILSRNSDSSRAHFSVENSGFPLIS